MQFKKRNTGSAKKYDKSIKIFSSEIKGLLKDNLIWLKVFGSYVNGNFTKKSDIDILVLVKNKDLSKEDALADIADRYYEEESILFSPLVYTEYEYKMNKKIGSTFFKEIDRKGVFI